MDNNNRSTALFHLFLIGCAVSLVVSGRLAIRLIAGGMIRWAAIPLIELAVAAIARPREPINAMSRPLILWAIGVAAFVALLSPLRAEALSATVAVEIAFAVITLVIAALSTPRETLRLRVTVWAIALACLFGFAAWPIVAEPWGIW